jgi:hypothetical protein
MLLLSAAALLSLAACSTEPIAPADTPSTAGDTEMAAAIARAEAELAAPEMGANGVAASYGPSDAPYNLNVLLKSASHNGGLGLLAFRQRADEPFIAHLNILVIHLAANSSYRLQRAADPFDGQCTSESWLTLGKGSVPQDITTNGFGIGYEELFRNLSAFPAGTSFDIRFRVIDAAGAVVLSSECRAFTIRG